MTAKESTTAIYPMAKAVTRTAVSVTGDTFYTIMNENNVIGISWTSEEKAWEYAAKNANRKLIAKLEN